MSNPISFTNFAVHYAPLFGVNFPLGLESPTFIQNVTQLAKMGFDSPENAKLFLQLDSIALNSSKAHPVNITLTAPTINHIISVYNQMEKNNSIGGYRRIATAIAVRLGRWSHILSQHRVSNKIVSSVPNYRSFLVRGMQGAHNH